MVTIRRKRYRKRHEPTVRPSQPAAAAGPVLVGASFDSGGAELTLTFDRAVDVSGFDIADVVVFDGANGLEWAATPEVSVELPATVKVVMIEGGAFVGAGVSLTASDGAGIVAVEGAVPWSGVTELALPFP